VKIYITGDTHGEHSIDKLSHKKWPIGRNLTKKDYVIICGDFGLLWKNEPDKNEKYWLKWLDERPFTTLMIDGNHENHTRLDALPKEVWNNGIIGRVNDSVIHLKRGEIYTINNKKFLTIGGAASIDKANRTIDMTWWERELLSQAEEDYAIENLEVNQWEVDYIISHTAPQEIIKYLYRNAGMYHKDPVAKFLDHIKSNLKFKKWYFGHLHMDQDFLNYHAVYNRILEVV